MQLLGKAVSHITLTYPRTGTRSSGFKTLVSTSKTKNPGMKNIISWNGMQLKKLPMVVPLIFDNCLNDVTVLRWCAIKIRRDILSLTEVDRFKSVTIFACQKHFKTYVVKNEEIAIISTHGYSPTEKPTLKLRNG